MFENIQIKPMDQTEALEIANKWKYPAPYNFYDMTADQEDYDEILNKEQRKNTYFSVKNNNELVGFFCVFPKDYSSKNHIEMGIGMKPKLTGAGFGKSFVQLVVDYLNKHYFRPTIWLSVADFNQRAMKVYEQVGFRYIQKVQQEANGGEYTFVIMNNEVKASQFN